MISDVNSFESDIVPEEVRHTLSQMSDPYSLLLNCRRLEPNSFEPRKLVESTLDTFALSAPGQGSLPTCAMHPKIPVMVEGNETLLRCLLFQCLSYVASISKDSCITIEVEDLSTPTSETCDLFFRLSTPYRHNSVPPELATLQIELCRFAARLAGGELDYQTKLGDIFRLEFTARLKQSQRIVTLLPRTDFSVLNIAIIGKAPNRLRDICKQLTYRGANVTSVRMENFLQDHDVPESFEDNQIVILDSHFVENTALIQVSDELERRLNFKETAVLVTRPGLEFITHVAHKKLPYRFLPATLKPSVLYASISEIVEATASPLLDLERMLSFSSEVEKRELPFQESFLDTFKNLLFEEATSCVYAIEDALTKDDFNRACYLISELEDLASELPDDALQHLNSHIYISVDGITAESLEELFGMKKRLQSKLRQA